jgi:hypothetical protein
MDTHFMNSGLILRYPELEHYAKVGQFYYSPCHDNHHLHSVSCKMQPYKYRQLTLPFHQAIHPSNILAADGRGSRGDIHRAESSYVSQFCRPGHRLYLFHPFRKEVRSTTSLHCLYRFDVGHIFLGIEDA